MAGKKVKIGDNSLNGQELQEAIERIDNLEEQKRQLSADVSEIYSQLRNRGYNTKVVRKLRKLIDQDAATRQEEHMLLKLYADTIDLDFDPFS